MSYGAVDQGDIFMPSSMLSNTKRSLNAPGAVEEALGDGLDNVLELNQKIYHSVLPSSNDLPGLFLPWLLFTLVVVPDSLLVEDTLAVFSMATCTALAVFLLYYSRGAAWRLLAVVCLVAPAGAHAMGHYARGHYLNLSLLYERSPSYTNVLSTEMPAAYQDASQINFTVDSYVDPSRSVGYRHTRDYCAAPIVRDEGDQVVGFWAVGMDCCAGRGSFTCGRAREGDASHTGAVVMDAGAFAGDVPHYMSAVEMASAVYGLILPADPILIKWNTDAGATVRELRGDTRAVCGMAVLIFLLTVPVAACCLGIFHFPLSRRPKANGWHPEALELMRFGPELIPRKYGAEFQHDLYQGRCYWSGEVIHDYVFYMANTHIFLGIFLSHPAHKYGKLERAVLGGVFASLIVFTVAAFSSFVSTGAGRTIFVLADVFIFRSIVKLYHFRGRLVNTEFSMEDSTADEDVAYYQCAFVGFLILLAVCTCFGMGALMSSRTSRTASRMNMGGNIANSVDALGYAFALELFFSIAAPFYINTGNLAGRWSWGFFGRWTTERDFYEAAQKEMEEHPLQPKTP